MRPHERQVVLSSWAKGDRDDLYVRGLDRWGEAQADEYLGALSRALKSLADFPEMGRVREDLRAGVRALPVLRHVIYYEVVDDEVRVGRILHVRQDPVAAKGI